MMMMHPLPDRPQTPDSRLQNAAEAEFMQSGPRWAEQGACHDAQTRRQIIGRCTGSTAGNVDASMQVCRYVYSVLHTTMHLLDGKDITGLEIGYVTDQPSFESQLDAGRGLHMRPTRESGVPRHRGYYSPYTP